MEQERPLESWKEISRYLHCSLRTCQRWEAELDLPVHRLDGTPKARVFAYREELDRWLKDKLNHSDEVRKSREAGRSSLKKLSPVLAAGIAVLALGGLVVPRLVSPTLPPIPELKLTLAVLPFENASGDESMDTWRTALPDLVVTDMAQSRLVGVVRITDLYRAVVGLGLGEGDRFSDDDLRKVAERTGADRVATGAIEKAGGGMTLTVSVKDPGKGEAPPLVSVEFGGERDVFAAVDSLTRGIKGALGLDKEQISRDIDRDVRKVSTASPQAFVFFSRGYRLAGIRKEQEAIALLQKAVESDPKFALAYKYLWRASMNLSRESDEKAYIRMAVGLSGRLSEKERGDLTVLFYRDYDEDPAKEQEALKRLWRYHPDDRFGGGELIGFYREREDWVKGLAVAEKCFAANRTDINVLRGLVTCYENTGQSDRAQKIVDEFVGANPEHPFWAAAIDLRVDCLLLDGRFDDALAELQTLSDRYPGRERSNLFRKSIVLINRGDFAGAEKELEEALGQVDISDKLEALMCLRDICLFQGKVGEAKSLLSRGIEIAESGGEIDPVVRAKLTALHYEFAYLHSLTGDLEEALKEAEKAEAALRPLGKKPWNPRSLLDVCKVKADILIKMNKMEDFNRLVSEVRNAIAAQRFPKLMKDYHYLLGLGEMKKNDPERAAEHFWQAADLVSVPGPDLDGADPRFFYALAEASERSKRVGVFRALPIYEKVISLSVNRIHCGDLYARSLLGIARISDDLVRRSSGSAEEIRLNRAKAVEHYRKFLEIWKDADPIFAPEIKDARERLAALESENGLPWNTDRPTK